MFIKQKRILWPIGLMIALGLSVLALALGKQSAGIPVQSQQSESADILQTTPKASLIAAEAKTFDPQQARASMEVEAITITARGLEPAEIRRPADPFLLRIQNHSRPAEFSFEIYRANGQKLHQLRGKRGQMRLVKIVDLPPGQYVVKELNHPQWSCSIILSAK